MEKIPDGELIIIVESMQKPSSSIKFSSESESITGKQTPPLQKDKSFIAEIKETYYERYLGENNSAKDSIFEWMNSGHLYRTNNSFVAWDIFINENIWPNATHYESNFNEFLKEMSVTPYYNPSAIFMKKENGTFYSFQERNSLRCVPQNNWFEKVGEGEELVKKHKLNLMDMHRNWKFRPWIDCNNLFKSVYDKKIHMTRYDYEVLNEKVEMPDYRKRHFESSSHFEFIELYNSENSVRLQVTEYCKVNKIIQIHREFTDHELGDFRCYYCHYVCHLPVICQDENRKPGYHYYCYSCVKDLIMARELYLCCEMEIVECPVMCGRFLLLKNNLRPSLSDQYKMSNFFDICIDCHGRFKSKDYKNHIKNCLKSIVNTNYNQKIKFLETKVKTQKLELDKKYEELETKRNLQVSQLNYLLTKNLKRLRKF